MAAETQTFDYGSDVDDATRHDLERIAVDVELDIMAASKRVIVIGQKLARARDKCLRVNGGFEAWIEKRCGISSSWAYSAIKAADKTADPATVADLSVRALFGLVRDNVPDSAREEVAERVHAGETVDDHVAAEIVQRHKDRSKPVRTALTAHDEQVHEGEQEFEHEEPESVEEAASEPELPAPLFAHVPELPPDVADALDAMKVCILRHKLDGWRDISRADLIDLLGGLVELARRPADAA